MGSVSSITSPSCSSCCRDTTAATKQPNVIGSTTINASTPPTSSSNVHQSTAVPAPPSSFGLAQGLQAATAPVGSTPLKLNTLAGKTHVTINPVAATSNTSIPRGRTFVAAANPLLPPTAQNNPQDYVSFVFEDPAHTNSAAQRDRAVSLGARSATRAQEWGAYSLNSVGNRSAAQSQLTDRGVAFGNYSTVSFDPRGLGAGALGAGIGGLQYFSSQTFPSADSPAAGDAFSESQRRQRSSGSGSVSVEEQTPSRPIAESANGDLPPSHNASAHMQNPGSSTVLTRAAQAADASQSLDGFMEARSHTGGHPGDMVSTMTMFRSQKSLLTNHEGATLPLLTVPTFSGSGGPLGASERERSTSGFVDMTLCSASLDSGAIGMQPSVVQASGSGVGAEEEDDSLPQKGGDDDDEGALAAAENLGSRHGLPQMPKVIPGIRKKPLKLATFDSKSSGSASSAGWPHHKARS